MEFGVVGCFFRAVRVKGDGDSPSTTQTMLLTSIQLKPEEHVVHANATCLAPRHSFSFTCIHIHKYVQMKGVVQNRAL